MTTPVEVVFVAGFTRSGSTLLDRLLGQTGEFRSLGEMRNIWSRGLVGDELCGCGERFDACPFWAKVAAVAMLPEGRNDRVRIAERASRLDRTRNVPLLLLSRPAGPILPRSDHLARLGSLYRAVREVSGSNWLVDSSKQGSYAGLLTEVPGLRVHVVHLVRDSRAVAFSWLRKKERIDAGRGELMPVVPARVSALRWVYHNAAVELVRRRAASYVLIRYENLMEAPERALRTILDSVGAPAPSTLDFLGADGAELPTDHTVSGNPDRLHRGRVPLRLDDEWTSNMRERDVRVVTSLTAPLLRRYGYAVGRGA